MHLNMLHKFINSYLLILIIYTYLLIKAFVTICGSLEYISGIFVLNKFGDIYQKLEPENGFFQAVWCLLTESK